MIIGIDLGTTNSLVSVWGEKGPQLIPNKLGEMLTPSCVSIDEDGSVLIGNAARDRLQTHPERSTALFKRYMGSERIVRIGKRDFRPEELSSLILRALKEDAEAYLGHPVTEAIITVPAYFSEAQRKATKTAGRLAGLNVERLLNEPTAAALAYGIHQREAESKFLVFDLGGGTFDVSVLDLFEGVMEVRATTGDNFLGGEDFVGVINDLFFAANQTALRFKKEALFMQRLFAAAEQAKRQLSKEASATIQFSYRDKEFSLTLTEAEFEKACAPLLVRLRDPVERALRDANIHPSELDSIVLAGGATRMPIVRRMVSRMFGRFPSVDINPDEVIALGAAVQASLKMKNSALSEVVMTDVAPYSLGIDVSKRLSDNSLSSGHFDPIIERNSVIPISRVKKYFPITDNQAYLELNIYQGESRMVKDNIKLGSLRVKLGSGPCEENPVDVRFTYDVNGLLQVEARTAEWANPYTLIIEGNPGILSEQEITERLAAIASLKIHPRDRIESRTILAKAERIYQQLLGDERVWLGQQIFMFEQALETQDDKVIAPAKTVIESVLTEIESQNRLQPTPDPSW